MVSSGSSIGKGFLVRALAILTCATVLTACESLPFGKKEDTTGIVVGERVSILRIEEKLVADERLADLPIQLPLPIRNADWRQTGGNTTHSMQHLAIKNNLKVKWKRKIGRGTTASTRIVASPIIVGDVIYAMDSRSHVVAMDRDTGKRIWRKNLTPKGETAAAGFGGGLTYEIGRLFVSTGFGHLMALDPDNGEEIWREDFAIPFRSAPKAASGRLFAITVDSQLHAVSAIDGKRLWSHRAIAEAAGILSDTSAAIDGNVVVAPFASGELVALRASNGRQIWSDALTRTGRMTAMSDVNAIAARPVIDRGRVIAVSHAGRLASVDIRTGERVWDLTLSGIHTPWVAGAFVYLVTTDAELLCVSRRDGRIRWVKALPRYLRPDKKTRPVDWVGPLLAGNRLYVFSSRGKMLGLSPYTGRILEEKNLGSAFYVAPIVVNEVVYILNDDGKLLALEGTTDPVFEPDPPLTAEEMVIEEKKLEHRGFFKRLNPF